MELGLLGPNVQAPFILGVDEAKSKEQRNVICNREQGI